MKKGFLAGESRRHVMDGVKGLAITWVIVLILGMTLMNAANYVPKLSGLISIIVAAVFLPVFATTVLLVPGGFSGLMHRENYANLVVYVDGVDKEEAGRIIDAEASQGKILVEEYIHSIDGRKIKFTKRKIVLVPSYLLLYSDGNTITAIPTDKIYWICLQIADRGGKTVSKLKVFYDRKIQDIEGIEFLHSYYIIEKIQQYIPDVFYDYNPFTLVSKLEYIFYRDYNQFTEIYNQHRDSYLEWVQQGEENGSAPS